MRNSSTRFGRFGRFGISALVLPAVLLGLASSESWAQRSIDANPPEPPPAAAAPDLPVETGPAPAPEVVPDTPAARAKILAELYGKLAAASDTDSAKPIADAIERVWLFSGSDTTDLLMQRATQAVNDKTLDLALVLLNAVVELQPDYAEGWNRRAYVYFLQNEMQRSLGDLRRALALEPMHFRALEGLANILRQEGSKKTSLEALKKLLEVNPNAPGVKQAIEELTREVEGQGI